MVPECRFPAATLPLTRPLTAQSVRPVSYTHLSFVGPLAALIQTIPGPVIGGISFLLYGMIGTSGLRILVDNHVDYSKNRNMILTSVIFVTGLSGVTLALGDVSLSGMTLAAIVGMIMSLVFYAFDKFHLSNDA